jgi:hypothetical protein
MGSLSSRCRCRHGAVIIVAHDLEAYRFAEYPFERGDVTMGGP